MYEPARPHASNAAFIWPALLAASASEMAARFAKQFTSLAIGSEGETPPPPQWTTPHRVALKLKTVGLRDFATSSDGPPCLLCTPYALHGSTLSDLAAGYSLVAALRDTGATNLFVTDWQSASSEMRYLGIDDYLADLNVLAPSVLSTLADGTAMEVFREVVRLGDGLVLGNRVLKLWGPGAVEAEEIRQLLESEEAHGSPAFARLEAAFRDWYARTVDLPGRYFLETVEKLYKRNAIAAGTFEALGKPTELKKIVAPLFLFAARYDELVTPPQLFAVERLVGTPPHQIRKLTADCRHLGLFMGKRILREMWPSIVDWLMEPATIARNKPVDEMQPAA
jgi:PHB depolymerase-like protein